MDSEKAKRISDLRASFGSFSNYSINNGDLTDPISAYFKQRCGNLGTEYLKKNIDSDSDSSVGCFDVDRVSLFDDGNDEENEIKSLRFSEVLTDPNTNTENINKVKKETDGLKVKVESELDKQRLLAQHTLKRLSKSPIKELISSPKKTENKPLADISSKFMNMKLSVGKNSEGWFQPNLSPNTPRYFNDELGSVNGEDESISNKSENKTSISCKVNEKRHSEYAKKINSIFKELTDIQLTSDLVFEPQTKEEQINRFEEDEKKFKLENSGLLHNSLISQFSGAGGDEWPSEATAPEKDKEIKNLSIGQFFNLRSNRVSSLVGSVDDGSTIPDINLPSEMSSLTESKKELLSKSECSFPIVEKSSVEKTNFRRCVSNLDLNRSPEISKSIRNSSDSCSSNSTLLIQGILADMESGLSGTQMYEKLMKSFRRRKAEEPKPKTKKKIENCETPKSSKVSQPKNQLRAAEKVQFSKEISKESKGVGEHNSFILKNDFETPQNLKLNETIPSGKKEKSKRLRNGKIIFASTPKSQAVKFQIEKLKSSRSKVLMSSENWETPRVHSIQPVELDKSELSEENDKTVLLSSTSTCSDVKKINDTISIEDTIVAGDLTVLSQRIDEMKRDSVCIVRPDEPKEPILLTVVQKLSHYPKGSVDCSALAPLIRDQFPELLSQHEALMESSSVSILPTNNAIVQDELISLSDSSIKFPSVWGQKQKIYAFADVQKKILVPVVNMSHNWFLVSLENVELVYQQGKKLPGEKKQDEWCVSDFISISVKKTFLPPENNQFLKVFFQSKVPIKLEVILTFYFRDIINRDCQKRNLRLLVNNVNPENYINVLPKDPINFGVIPDQCFDQTVVQLSFDGISELPLTVYIEEDESLSGHFILKPVSGHQRDEKYKDNMCYHVFQEGEKQVLELRVWFLPKVNLKEDSETQEFKANLVLMLGGKTDSDGILRKIPIKGSVGYAQFVCNFVCIPLVFRASERGQSVTRAYSLRNTGSIPITFSVSVAKEDSDGEDEENLFVVPKSFYLAKDEEAGFNIVFNARSNQDCVKRRLRLRMKPNGRVLYEADLIGIVSLSESRPSSRTSGISVSTKSATDTESAPVKIVTSCHSLSWTGVALENEARQSFQIKILSTANASVRITFERNSSAFKLVNENGEKVHKLRKTLIPDCPCVLTVVFRPDVVGSHSNCLRIECSRSPHHHTITLNGIGGIPNIQMKNVKPDLTGGRVLNLHHSNKSNEFENIIVCTNTGRIPAFVYLKAAINDFSLSHEITVSPSAVVINPDSSVTIRISQKLKNRDLQQLLSKAEIYKVATLCAASGDEPSRQRLRKLLNNGQVQPSERIKSFTAQFLNEKELNLRHFKDSQTFEMEFWKSIRCTDIQVVIEKGCDTSFLEETAVEFMSFCSDKTIIPSKRSQDLNESNSEKVTSSDPADLQSTIIYSEPFSRSSRVNKWLDTLECPYES